MGHHIDTPNAVALYLDLDLLGIPRDDDPALIEKAHRALQAAQAKAKPLASPIMTLRSLIGLVRHRDTGHSILAIVIPDARLASPLDELAADAYDFNHGIDLWPYPPFAGPITIYGVTPPPDTDADPDEPPPLDFGDDPFDLFSGDHHE